MAAMAYSPVQNGDRGTYGAGGGGKMRPRRAPKRNGTPYDRPAVGRHASAGPQAAALMNANGGAADGARREGWLGSRLLGTASKIVTSGASFLYSSFFRRPAGDGLLLLKEAEKTAANNAEGQTDTLSPSAAEVESMEAGSQQGEEDKTSEVESWMKRTFSREEADRLIASFKSYSKENGTAEEQVDHVNTEEQRTTHVNHVPALESAPSNGQLSDAQRWREERTKARQEQKSNHWPGDFGKENGTPTEAGASEGVEIVAVDVARAYMGERVTRVVTPARVTLTREKVPTQLRLSPYQSSPYMLRKQQPTNISTQYGSADVPGSFHFPPPGGLRSRDIGFDENLRTPALTRTVGRPLPVARITAPSSAIGYSLPGEGSKKRGSAALEDGGYSSGGPIRRLRPRSSLYTPSPASGILRRGSLGVYPPPPRALPTPVDVKQKVITMWSRNVETEGKGNAKFFHQHEESKSSEVEPNASVPERASATARKILETLDMMTPSPKQKSLDTELAFVRERPPTELITSMVNDKARQTMQSWDFAGPQEEAGPSGQGRNLEDDLYSAAGGSRTGAEQGTKSRVKGKAPASALSHASEDKSRDQPSFPFQDASRLKFPESSLANQSPVIGKNKGFQINADFDDSDEETRGTNATLLTPTVTNSTSFTTGKNSSSGAGLFDNDPPRSSSFTADVSGPSIGFGFQRDTSETTVIDGKSTAALGGFTFPSSNSFGTTMEPPPTPKPFPSPSSTESASKSNGPPSYKFNTGALIDNMVLKLPSTGAGGADNSVHTDETKSKHQTERKPDSLQSDLSVSNTSNAAEAPKGQTSMFGSSGPETSTTATTSLSSTFSLAKFGAPGAGAMSGIFGSGGQTASSTAGFSNLTTSVSTTETNLFNPGKTGSSPSAEPATLKADASLSAGSKLFGNAAVSPAPSTAATSSSAFGTKKDLFSFGAAASTSPAPPLQSTAPASTLDDADRPQKRPFGQEKTIDNSAAAPVTFGLSAAGTIPASALSTANFSTSVFGQGSSSPAPASNSTSLFGFKPSPATSTTSTSSLATTSFGTTNAFGSSSLIFGSSTFGSSNPTPALGGASSSPIFGASSTASFGASSTPTFGSSSAPAFGASSTPAFGASSTSAFGASSNPAFGASSIPAFGTSGTATFGAPSTPAFGASSTAAFEASSTPTFGASSTPIFGASSTPAFGTSNTNNKPAFGGFSSEAPAQPSQSHAPVFGFGSSANTGSSPSPAPFSFGSSVGSGSPFAFGSGAALPTTSTGAFAFGASSAPSPTTSTGAFAFGGSSAASPAPFSFGAKPSSPSMFGVGSSAPAFSSTPNGGTGTDMEDSMADDGQMMASSPPPQQTPVFGAAQNAFGKPTASAPAPAPVFGGFGSSAASPVANPFAASSTPQPSPPIAANPFAPSPQPGQPLNFGGGGFALGSTGQDSGAKPNRKFIKAKRAGSVKRK